jgi:hypothetical protein
MSFTRKLSAAINEALGEQSLLRVPASRILSIANQTERSLDNLVKLLGFTTIKEDVEGQGRRRIHIKIKEIGQINNLYEVTIPAKGMESGRSGMIKAYSIRKNAKLADEDDDEATARIIDDIKSALTDKIAKHKEAIKRGDTEEAQKILYGEKGAQDRILGMFRLPQDAINQFKKLETKEIPAPTPGYSASQARGIKAFAARSMVGRQRMLHSEGLLSRQDVIKGLNLVAAEYLPQFSINIMNKMIDVYPQWDELRQIKKVGFDDIRNSLPAAKVNGELVEFIANFGNVNTNALSEDAAEALAAVSLVISATLRAVDNKMGGE